MADDVNSGKVSPFKKVGEKLTKNPEPVGSKLKKREEIRLFLKKYKLTFRFSTDHDSIG